MSKRIEIEGEFYRIRRGKLVKIPTEWLGKVTTKTTIRNRKKLRNGKFKGKSKIRAWDEEEE